MFLETKFENLVKYSPFTPYENSQEVEVEV